MQSWLQNYETLALWLAAASAVMFLAGLIAVPVALVRLPANYFVKDHHTKLVRGDSHPVLRLVWLIVRSVVGLALILAGVLMLVLPGQGIVTVLAGVMLLQFPGKHRLQYWIVTRDRVLRSINWLRRRADRPPLQIHEAP